MDKSENMAKVQEHTAADIIQEVVSTESEKPKELLLVMIYISIMIAMTQKLKFGKVLLLNFV